MLAASTCISFEDAGTIVTPDGSTDAPCGTAWALRKYLEPWAPLRIAVGRQSIFTVEAVGTPVSATPRARRSRVHPADAAAVLYAHLDVAGLDPAGVVDDAVYVRVGLDPSAEALAPVRIRTR